MMNQVEMVIRSTSNYAPPAGRRLLAWTADKQWNRHSPCIARWSPDEIVTGGEFDVSWGAVWHDGEDGNPDGDGELHAPPGWWVQSHDVIDGGEHEYYWLGTTECVSHWAELPRAPG